MKKRQKEKMVILVLALICIQLIFPVKYLFSEGSVGNCFGINSARADVTTDEQVEIIDDDNINYEDDEENITFENVRQITTDSQTNLEIKHKIYITDFDGKFLGTTDSSYSETPNRLNLDNGVNIRWTLEIPKHLENRIHVINFSEEINVPSTMEVFINSDADDSSTIGKATFYSDHKAVIEFYSNDYDYSMDVNFCLSTTINKDMISFLDDKFDLNFVFDDISDDKISISFLKPQIIDPEQTDKIPAAINKVGSYDPITRTIEWTIITWPHGDAEDGRNYKDLYIKDVLEPNQTYIEGSMVNTDGIEDFDFGLYSCENGSTKAIVIKNLEFANDKWTSFKFKTKVSDSYINNGDGNKSINNVAYLIKENTMYAMPSPVASVSIGYGYNFINKEADYNDSTNIAKWKITVNGDCLQLEDVKLTDQFPSEYLELSSDVLINGQPALEGDGIRQYKYIQSTSTIPASLKINFGDISSEYIVEFETKVKSEYFNLQNFNKYTNKAYLHVDAGNYQGIYEAESNAIYVSSNPLGFMILGGENFSYKNHTYRWQSSANPSHVEMNDIVFTQKFEQNLLEFREDDPIEVIRISPNKEPETDRSVEAHYNLVKDTQNSTDKKIRYKVDNNSIQYYNGYDINLFGHAINTIAEYNKEEELLTIKENGTTNCLEIFYYKTLNIDSHFYANNKYVEHEYKSNLEWKDSENNIRKADASWWIRDYNLNLIQNTIENYNPLSHRMDWKITLNKNDIKLKNAVISENIPKGQKYAEESFKIEKKGLEGQPFNPGNLIIENLDDNLYSQKMTYEFGDSDFEGEYIITFQTEITPDIYTNATGREVVIKNTARIDGKDPMNNDTPIKTIESTDGIIIPTASMITTGEFGYDSTKRWIDWTIFFNMNSVYMKDVMIKDPLETGFAYDAESAKLYDLIIRSDGGYALGHEKPYLRSEYDSISNVCKFFVDTGLNGNALNTPYALKFRTYITDRDKLLYSNTAYLTASNILSEVFSEASKTTGIITNVSGDAERKQGIIEIHNYDKDDPNIKLAGGIFEIYLHDSNGELKKLGRSIADQNGIVKFYNLPYGVYYVKQIRGVQGYRLSEKDNINVNAPIIPIINMPVSKESNIINNGNVDIIITKTDKLNNPLKGAEFGLFSKDNEEVCSGISDVNGKINFINIPYGVYDLKEKKAPEGYKNIEECIEILIDESTEQFFELKIENKLKDELDDPDIVEPDSELEPDSDPDKRPDSDENPNLEPKPDLNPEPDLDLEPNFDKKTDHGSAQNKKPHLDKKPDSDINTEESIIDIESHSGMSSNNSILENNSLERSDNKNNTNDKEINESEEKEIQKTKTDKKVKRYDNKWDSATIKERDVKVKEDNIIVKSLKSRKVENGVKILLGLAGAMLIILPNKYKKQRKKYKPIIFKNNKCHMFLMYYEESKGWHNGNIVTEQQFKLENEEDIVAYDNCFFEKIRAYKNEEGDINLVKSKENLDRVNKIYKELCIPKIDINFMTEQIKKLIKVDKSYISRNVNQCFNINIGIIAKVKDDYIPTNYILYAKCEFDEENIVLPDLYITNKYLYLNYNGLKDMDKLSEKDSIIWSDSCNNGIIEETGQTSIMFVINGILFINKLQDDIVPSVMRTSIIDIAKDLNIEVKEEKIPISFITESIDNRMLTEIIIADNNNEIKCVSKIFYKDKEYPINHNDLFVKITERLNLIGLGKISDNDNWITPIN